MINSIIKFITSKEIILYDKHRQIEPLVSNKKNKKIYYFINVGAIWKIIPFKTAGKKKHKIMYFILSCIQPKYIISMNWLTKRESLYKVWTANNSKSKFMVIQHGVYCGGTVTDVPHKYTNCDVFFTWGPYFTTEFSKFNSLKKVEIFNFGNSIYNTYNRHNYNYKNTITNKILILPTALDAKNILYFNTLIKKLQKLKYEVFLKEHGKQGLEKNKNGTLKYPSIEGVTKITGQVYSLLQNNEYDFIIADHSTSLLDAIFFKNKVLYCDPNNKNKGYTTQYSKYLANIFLENYTFKYKNYFEDLINISNQEALLAEMISEGNNELDSKFYSKY